MICKINSSNQNPHFCGTTIIKKEGGSFLTKEIQKAADCSRPMGFINTRLDGYSIVVVSDVFEKDEAIFLRELRERNLDYVNSTKILNYKNYTITELKKWVKIAAKAGLL